MKLTRSAPQTGHNWGPRPAGRWDLKVETEEIIGKNVDATHCLVSVFSIVF